MGEAGEGEESYKCAVDGEVGTVGVDGDAEGAGVEGAVRGGAEGDGVGWDVGGLSCHFGR